MENAADALKMAAAILIFIIAIASSFSLFGTAKQTADSIIKMRDKQAYLEAAELDNGVLYTSSDAIAGGSVLGVTTNGDRIVNIDDVVSTIYRYSKEKYGVTIVESDGTVIVRFDSNTEGIMAQYNDIQSGLDDYIDKLKNNTKNDYVEVGYTYESQTNNTLYTIYGDSGVPWYGNDFEIQRRINCDLEGITYTYNNKTYEGKSLLTKLQEANQIIEITNEIDQSKYLQDNGQETNLLQQYNMPTVEVVYILK